MIAPLAILVALYYRIYGFERSLPFAGARAARRRAVRGRDRDAHQARAAPRPAVGGGDLRHRLDRGARAGADLRAGKRLAHRRARPDGAGHRLGRRAAPAAVAALALRRARRARHAAHRLRAAHRRRTSAPRRSSTGSCTATAFRRSPSGSRAGCCASAPTTCRRAWSMPARSCSRCSPRPRRSATTSTAATSTTRPPASPKSRCRSAAASRWRSASNGCALRTNSIVHDVAALLIAGFCLLAIVFGLLLFDNPWIWTHRTSAGCSSTSTCSATRSRRRSRQRSA